MKLAEISNEFKIKKFHPHFLEVEVYANVFDALIVFAKVAKAMLTRHGKITSAVCGLKIPDAGLGERLLKTPMNPKFPVII